MLALRGFLLICAFVAFGLGTSITVLAEPFAQGAKVCNECHEAEFKVWEGSQHHKSFDTIFDSDRIDTILEALGEDDMEESALCTTCHFTVAKEAADDDGEIVSGPSCESCHGGSSDWVKVHNDFGGPAAKAETETADHKAERHANAAANGMIWSHDKFGIASNCMSCHGLAHDDVDGDALAKMLDAGHPLNLSYELVQYSQGTVRHRFYAPDITTNAEMNAAELSNLWVQGQAAKLVSAARALKKGSSVAYQKAQQQRFDDAKAELSALGIAEADALVADPNDANARELAAAIAGIDLSAKVSAKLPDPGSYK